ncbi:unnamed protein product [Amoebophrya sp. A120]|nr:unnamed protein product [Amoebophrya sp. A120]|eukprot:GSA120T00008575001.1
MRRDAVRTFAQYMTKLEGELLAKNGNVSPPKDYEEAWYRALRANEECFRQLVDQKLRIEELEHSDKSSGSGAGTKLEEGLQAKNQMPVVVIPGKVVPQDYEENCHRASLLNGQALPRIEELEHAQNRGAAKKLIAGIKPRTYSNQILAKNPATQEHFKQVLYGAKRDGPGAGIVRFRMFSGTNIYPKNVWENDGLYTWFVADFSYAGQGTPSWKIHASTYVSVTDFTVKHYNNEKIVSVFVYSADYYNPCESEKFLAGGEKAVHDRAINAGLSNALSPKTSFPSEAEQLRAWYAETLAATVGKMLGNFSLRIGMTLLGTSRFSSSLRPGHKLWIGVVEIFAVYDELFRRATGTLPQQVKNVAEHLHLMSWEGAPFLARYDENGKKTQEKIAEIECLIYVLGTVSNAFTDSFESRSEQGKRQKEKKGIAIPDGRVFLDEDTPRFAAPWSDHASKIPC